MTTANLGFAIDSSSAKRAVVDLDALEAAAANTEAKVVSLGRRSKTAFAELGSSATGFAAQLQSAAARAETLAERINRSMNIKMTLSGAERGRDIEEYGRRLDALRARYNPLYAQVQQYKTALADIRQAHALGAISSDEMSAAIQRERRATLESISALKGRKAALEAAQGGGQKFQTANIAAQFQDIGVTAAMGMSPIMIALQQGTQLSSILNTMDKPVLGLAQAFQSVLNPVSLVTMAIVAAGAALIQYFSDTEKGAKKAETILKEHAATVAMLKERYGEAAEGLREYANEGMAGTLVELRDRLKDARDMIKEAASARSTYSPMVQPFAQGTDPSVLSAWRTAFIDLRESIKSGEPDILRFRDAMARIAENETVPQGLRKLATEMRTFKEEGVVETARAIPSMVAQLNLIGGSAQSQVRGVQDLNKALRELAGISLPALNDTEQALRLYETAVARASSREDKDFAYSQYQDALKRIDNQNPTINNSDGNMTNVPLPGQKPVMLGEVNKSAERAANSARNAYRDLLKSAQDRIDQMKLEEQLVGKTGIAAEALRFELDLLQKSEDKGRSATAEQTKALKEKAAAYKEIAEKVAAARMGEELMFERQQMFRSPTEQRVSGELRNLGIDPSSAAGEQIANQIRLNEAIQQSIDLSKDFASTFVSDILSGKSATEALTNALSKMADRLLSMALDQAINSLFGSLFGGMGGGKGFFPSAPLPMYADGTNYAAGGMAIVGERGPELVNLPRGSQVVPNHKLRAANMNDASSKGASSSTQNVKVMSDVKVSVDPNGNLQAYVQGVSTQVADERTAAGIRSYDSAKRNMRQNGGGDY